MPALTGAGIYARARRYAPELIGPSWVIATILAGSMHSHAVRALAMSVLLKSSPLYNSGSPVSLVRA